MSLFVWMWQRSRAAPLDPVLFVLAIVMLTFAMVGVAKGEPFLVMATAVASSHLLAWTLFNPEPRASVAVAVLPISRWVLYGRMVSSPLILAQLPCLLLFATSAHISVPLLVNVALLIFNAWTMLIRFGFPASPLRAHLAYVAGVISAIGAPPIGILVAVVVAVIAALRRPECHVR